MLLAYCFSTKLNNKGFVVVVVVVAKLGNICSEAEFESGKQECF